MMHRNDRVILNDALCVFDKQIKSDLEDAMVKQIKTKYINETADDDISLTWNSLQQEVTIFWFFKHFECSF